MKRYLLISLLTISTAFADCAEEIKPHAAVVAHAVAAAAAPVVPAPEKPLGYSQQWASGKLQFKSEYFADAGEVHYFSNAGGFVFTYVGKLLMSATELARLKTALTSAAKTSKRVPSNSSAGDLFEIGAMDPQTGIGFVLERRSTNDTYVNTAADTFQLTQLIRWLSEP